MAAVLWRSSVRSFDIASRMKAVAIVIRKASRLSTLSHALDNTLSASLPRTSAVSGVRSRNSAPWVKNSEIAGQRETSGSLRPRQNS